MQLIQILVLILAILLIGFITRRTVIRVVEKGVFVTPPEEEHRQKGAYESGIERYEFFSGNYKLIGHWLVSSSDAPSVFILHGNGETASEWQELQLYLKDKDLNSFVFDYAGFGDSQGKPSVNVLRLNTMSAWNVFSTLAGSKEKIILAHSLGVAVILDSIKLLKNPADRLILHGAFSSARYLSVLFGVIPKWLSWLVPDIWNNQKAIRLLEGIDITVVHSKKDKKVPFEIGKAVASKSKHASFISIESDNHNAIYETPAMVWKHIKL